ncbi:DUF4936 family protein [Chitinimonas lacunae]|uniref:DUF4936 family protein n=1 Tax=Chitinimonas lacunae TaxID=1963018 RepID=A0ABV8MN79_9NEIS
MTEAANCFIYYKLPTGCDTAALEEQVRSFQVEIARLSAVQGSLHRRLDGAPTWMEVYPGVSDRPAFEALLARLSAGLPQPRQTEWFVEM